MERPLPNENPLAKLELPRRWELLQQKANEAAVDPSEVVERVDEAADHLDALLRRVRTGGGGLIEVVYGLSGSGKTTFLKTLPKFFENVRVSSFPNDAPITDLPKFVRSSYLADDLTQRIILIERRDNPKKADLDLVEDMFGDLLEVFREPEGAAVVLWPITKQKSAEYVAKTAWDVGRDSMADSKSRGQLHFKGVPRGRYFELADNTSRTLTGDGLEAFGITQSSAQEMVANSQTISDFFAAIDDAADHARDATWSVLRARVRTHLWVLLPGDDVKTMNATASALTQGTRSRIDVDLIGEFIDRPDNTSIYVNDWRKRRGSLAHLLRTIDVRLFSLAPNVSLAAIRAFGSPELRAHLRQQTTNRETAKSAMRASRLYKAILTEAGIETTAYAGPREIADETINEFLRIQRLASKDDKQLNKAVGALIAACLQEDAPKLKVTSEKRTLPGSNLQPDIQIELSENDFLCLEPTWRTSGRGIEGELDSAQNTLSEAHLKKYVLDKATQYVKDLGI